MMSHCMSTQLSQSYDAGAEDQNCCDSGENDYGLADDVLRIMSFKRMIARHLTESLDVFGDNRGQDRPCCKDDQPLPYYPFCSSASSPSSGVVVQIVRTKRQTAHVLSALRNRLQRSHTSFSTCSRKDVPFYLTTRTKSLAW